MEDAKLLDIPGKKEGTSKS